METEKQNEEQNPVPFSSDSHYLELEETEIS